MTRLDRVNRGRGHSYLLDGKPLDGVTTAISDGFPLSLKQWGADQAANYALEHWDELTDTPLAKRLDRIRFAHRETLNRAAARGTQIHAYGEALVHGTEVEIPPEHLGPARAYAKFLDTWQIEPVATETPLANTEYGYGGTADLWATIGARDNQSALIDLKTGSGVYTSVALQLAAYRRADLWQPEPGLEVPDVPQVEGVYAAWILPDAVELVPVEAGEREWTTFLYVLQVARWVRAHGFKSDDPVIGEGVRVGVPA